MGLHYCHAAVSMHACLYSHTLYWSTPEIYSSKHLKPRQQAERHIFYKCCWRLYASSRTDPFASTGLAAFSFMGVAEDWFFKMVKVEKIYKPRFVVVFSELVESDPILQNATLFPGLKNMPWYLSGALKGEGETYFLQKFEIPHGKTLDVIALDTVLLQDRSIARGNDQVMWLRRILSESNSDWKIVFGYHQLISCGHNVQKTNDTHFEYLHDILLQYGVDVYMSMKTCDDTAKKATCLTPMNNNLVSEEDTGGGFLFHGISSLEMVTLAVKLTGEIEHRSSFQPRGRAAI